MIDAECAATPGDDRDLLVDRDNLCRIHIKNGLTLLSVMSGGVHQYEIHILLAPEEVDPLLADGSKRQRLTAATVRNPDAFSSRVLDSPGHQQDEAMPFPGESKPAFAESRKGRLE